MPMFIKTFAIMSSAFLASFPVASLASGPDDGAPVKYVVRKGDTLISLGNRYLAFPTSYQTVQRQNRISNPHSIPVGTVLIIPRSLLKYRPASARLVSVRGQVIAASTAASVGQTIGEGSAITTGPSSFVTMQLDDGSRVSLPSNSDVRIRRLRHYVLGNSLDYDFDIAKGGARSTVIKHESADDRYRVRTPKAVSAVRGTDFQSRFDPVGGSDFAEVVEGALAVAAGSGNSLPLNAGNGLTVKADGGVVAEALLPPPPLREPGRLQADKLIRFATEISAPARFTIAVDAGFIEQIADSVTQDGNAVFTDIPNGNYFIRARAISANGIEGIPATYAFKRRMNGITANAGESDGGYVFRWAGEGGGTRRFHFQLFRNSAADVAIVDEAGLSGDRLTISDLPQGDFFWRVGAVQYLDGEVATNWTPLEKLSVSGN
ncbi:MAG: FecR domain-containing protein [Sphingomonadaceae bacterium]|nr:FecR domain-containing protein [Sphingomonadaceae bacterium]